MNNQEQESKKQTGIRISEKTIKELKIEALNKDISFQDLVNTILSEYIIRTNKH